MKQWMEPESTKEVSVVLHRDDQPHGLTRVGARPGIERDLCLAVIVGDVRVARR
jgi:hypothetical protein